MTEHVLDSAGIRDRIIKVIEEFDLTDKAFSGKTSIAAATVSNMRKKKQMASLEVINKVFSAFPEVNQNWLLFGEGDLLVQNMSFSEGLNSSSEEKDDGQQSNKEEDTTEKVSNDLFQKTEQSREIIRQEVSLAVKEALLSLIPSDKKLIEEIRVFYTDGSFESFVRK